MIYDSRFYEYNLLIDTNVMNEFTVVESQELITCNKLSFEKHFAKLWETASYKFLSLSRRRNSVTLQKDWAVSGNCFYRLSI